MLALPVGIFLLFFSHWIVRKIVVHARRNYGKCITRMLIVESAWTATPSCGRSADARICPGRIRCAWTCLFVEDWSMMADLLIALKTMRVVLNHSGAY